MDLPSLTNALNFFARIFDQGRESLGGQATSLFQILVLFEIIFAGLYLALGTGADFKNIAKKILTVGFFSWIIGNYSWLLRQVVEGFILVGQNAGSSSGITFATIQDPDLIFLRGLQLIKPAIDKLFQIADSSYLSIISADAFLLLVCIISSILAFGIMAIQIFVTYLEFLIITTAGYILIPFGIFKPTAFLAERVFGTIIGFGIKLMVLALVVAISEQFLRTIALPAEVTWQQGFEFVIISFALCFLTIQAPNVALSLLSGTPNLTFGSVVSTGAATAFGGSKTVSAGAGTAIGTGKLLGGGAAKIAGSAAGGAISNSARASERNSSTIGKVAAGAAGIVSGPIQAAVSSTADRVIWGKDGNPNGQVRYRASIGDETLKPKGSRGIVSHFNSGLYSVPGYRKHDQQKRSEKSKSTKNENNTEKKSETNKDTKENKQ